MPSLLTTAEFAAARGMPLQTVSAYCARGKIEGARFDARMRRWLIPKGAKIIEKRRGRPPSQ